MHRRSPMTLALVARLASIGPWLRSPVIHIPHADSAPSHRSSGKGRRRRGDSKPSQARPKHQGTHTKAARQRRRALRLRMG